jgi:8-oxo-dGTP diphosphatase
MIEPVVKCGVSVILIKEGRVLAGKRKGSHGQGLWAFPGGHIDPTDTSLKEAGEREVREETGIECEIYKPDSVRDDLFTTFDILSEDGSKRYVTCYLIAHYKSGGVWTDANSCKALEPKCEEWHWFTLDALENLVATQRNHQWIPMDKVRHYLRQLYGTMSDDPIQKCSNRMSGIWTLRGHRFSISQLLGELANGRSVTDIADDFDLDHAIAVEALNQLALQFNKPEHS